MGGRGSGRTTCSSFSSASTGSKGTGRGDKIIMTTLGGSGSGRTARSIETRTNDNTTKTDQSTINFKNDIWNRIGKNKSSTKTSANMIPALVEGETPSKAPKETSMIPTVPTPSGEVTKTTYNIKILYRSKTTQKDTDVIEKMKCLMARLIQYEKTVQMLPYDPASRANPIIVAKDIPMEQEEFEVYVPMSSIHPGSRTLRMNFRISAEVPLWKIKIIPNVRNYLNQFNIYLDQTYLSTIDNVKVGGLVLSHCQWTRRDVATNELNIRINENEDVKTPIQLAPHSMWNGKNLKKISTKLLAVECAKDHIDLVKHRMFTKFLNVPASMELSNTRFFKFIPFYASGAISDQVIRSGIYLQNKFLIQSTAITVINIKNLDWLMPNQTDTFRSIILNINIPNEEGKMFTSVEMGVLDNKAHLVTTKNAMAAATEWIDDISTKMKDLNESKDFWKERTGFSTPPVRLNKPINSDAQAAYAHFLNQTFTPLVGDKIEDSGPKMAPKKLSYSRVVYGMKKKVNENGSQSTQRTEVSTISGDSNNITNHDTVNSQRLLNKAILQMQEKASMGQADMKSSLLDEMKTLNKESTNRMIRMEEASKGYDFMLRELHENNKAKALEMTQYEKRLEQISMNTENTSTKVDTLSKDTANTAVKVDKLSLAMKTFIKVMTDVVGPNTNVGSNAISRQNNLRELVTFLEEEEEDNLATMEIDKQQNKRKSDTLPDDENVMSGKGSTK